MSYNELMFAKLMLFGCGLLATFVLTHFFIKDMEYNAWVAWLDGWVSYYDLYKETSPQPLTIFEKLLSVALVVTIGVAAWYLVTLP